MADVCGAGDIPVSVSSSDRRGVQVGYDPDELLVVFCVSVSSSDRRGVQEFSSWSDQPR